MTLNQFDIYLYISLYNQNYWFKHSLPFSTFTFLLTLLDIPRMSNFLKITFLQRSFNVQVNDTSSISHVRFFSVTKLYSFPLVPVLLILFIYFEWSSFKVHYKSCIMMFLTVCSKPVQDSIILLHKWHINCMLSFKFIPLFFQLRCFVYADSFF